MKVLVAGAIGLAAVGVSGVASAADFSARRPCLYRRLRWLRPHTTGVVSTSVSTVAALPAASTGMRMASETKAATMPSGGTFGGQIGYRWQTPSSWVFGLEAQGNWADFKGSNASLQFPGQTNQTTIDSFGLFTGQIGYAWDRTLLYAKGGAAVTDNHYTAISTLPPLIGFDVASESRWGATLGAGVEYAFAQNWSLGFEYDHLFMGNRDVNSATGFLIADHIKEDVDLFTARLNYKFGGPGFARY